MQQQTFTYHSGSSCSVPLLPVMLICSKDGHSVRQQTTKWN